MAAYLYLQFQGSISDFSMDSITRAVNHTMKLYEATQPTEEEYANMAEKIQVSIKYV